MSRLLDIFEEEKVNTNENQDIDKYEIAKGEYKEYLYKYEQVDMCNIMHEIQNTSDYEYLKNKLESIKKQYLYKSYGHGLSHNEKVMLFSLYIARKENIENEYLDILLDGAIYHDIGRINDIDDMSHGERGAIIVNNIIKYDNRENQEMLQFIIHAHSVNDIDILKILEKYKNINKKDIALKLAKILKDADALDRARLNEEDRLNPKYLRTNTSKTMLKFANQINECYYSGVYQFVRI